MGFDNECILNVHSVAREYFCPVCGTLVYPNEALQTPCTHLYCKPCLVHIACSTQACPYDGYLVTEADSKPLVEANKALVETIGKIAVRCLYHGSGCMWQGFLSECTTHRSGCAFGNSLVVCKQCGIQIPHSQAEDHAQICNVNHFMDPQLHQGPKNVQDTETSGAVVSTTDQSKSASTQNPSQPAIENTQPQGLPAILMSTCEQWYQPQYDQQYSVRDTYQQVYQPLHTYPVQATQQFHRPPLQVQGQAHSLVHGQFQPPSQVRFLQPLQPPAPVKLESQFTFNGPPQLHLHPQAAANRTQPLTHDYVPPQQPQTHHSEPSVVHPYPQSSIHPRPLGHPESQPYHQLQPPHVEHPPVHSVVGHQVFNSLPPQHNLQPPPQFTFNGPPQLHLHPQAAVAAANQTQPLTHDYVRLQQHSQPSVEHPYPQSSIQPRPLLHLQSQPYHQLPPHMEHPPVHSVASHQAYTSLPHQQNLQPPPHFTSNGQHQLHLHPEASVVATNQTQPLTHDYAPPQQPHMHHSQPSIVHPYPQSSIQSHPLWHPQSQPYHQLQTPYPLAGHQAYTSLPHQRNLQPPPQQHTTGTVPPGQVPAQPPAPTCLSQNPKPAPGSAGMLAMEPNTSANHPRTFDLQSAGFQRQYGQGHVPPSEEPYDIGSKRMRMDGGAPLGFDTQCCDEGLSHEQRFFGHSLDTESTHPHLDEPGFQSGYTSNHVFYAGGSRSFDDPRNREFSTMGWCHICKLDCGSVGGLEMHGQTSKHQTKAMAMVKKIKQKAASTAKKSIAHSGPDEASKSGNVGSHCWNKTLGLGDTRFLLRKLWRWFWNECNLNPMRSYFHFCNCSLS